MPRWYLHYLLVFLLLAAQQGALVHATWHALETHDQAAHAAHATHEGDGHDHEAPSGQASLCAFDLAFGQVLGGLHGACAPLSALVPAAVPVADVLNPRGSSDAVPTRSRGPPVVL